MYQSKHAGLTIDNAIDDAIAKAAEIVLARGGRSSLNNRLNTISNFASPNVGPNTVGRYLDQAAHAAAAVTLALVTGRFDLHPFYVSQPLDVDQVGVNVTTLAAGALAKVGIYSSADDGFPLNLLWQGDANLDLSTTGYKFHTNRFKFDAGRQYWLGVISSAAGTLSAIPVASQFNLGLQGTTATPVAAQTYATAIRVNATWAAGFPALIDAGNAAFTSTIAASIRMRMAAPL